LLTEYQIRGAFARYMEDLKADLKSIAASGWGAELIHDADILESQFPELLAENEQKRLRLAELSALFAAADEEDYEDSDDTGVLPAEEVKALKAELKEARAQAKLAKREGRSAKAFLARAEAAEARLARHKALEDEAKQLKAELRATEKKQEELVAAAREKIDRDGGPAGDPRSPAPAASADLRGVFAGRPAGVSGGAGESASEVCGDGQGDRGPAGCGGGEVEGVFGGVGV